MKLLALTLVLSLIAFASLSQAHELDWSKILKCSKVGTKVAAAFVREAVPGLRTYLTCIDYTPPSNSTKCLLGYIKIVYELLKRSVEGDTNCLMDPLKKGVAYLKPNIAELDKLDCFP